jgi:LacI family transcriptional regulator
LYDAKGKGVIMSTIKDIARRAGVSYATVSRVINNKSNVAMATRKKVLAAIDELSYYRNDLARGMRTKKTNSIGLILADITNPFYAETAKTIVELAGRYDYSLFLCNTNNDLNEQKKYINILMQRKVDGIIFASVHWIDPTIEALALSATPFVLYNRCASDSSFLNYVVLDNEEGAFLAVEHLYNLGHRRIALISGLHAFSTDRERTNGYIKALNEFGLPYDETLMVQGEYSGKKSFDAAMKLIKSENPPTAIFASNDLMALSALDAIMLAGLTVPDDIALIGFDDIAMASHSAIQLSTVSQDSKMMAEIAINSLYKIIENKESHLPLQVVLKPKLSIRLTCGSKKISK